jgi:hypothetical protein
MCSDWLVWPQRVQQPHHQAHRLHTFGSFCHIGVVHFSVRVGRVAWDGTRSGEKCPPAVLFALQAG